MQELVDAIVNMLLEKYIQFPAGETNWELSSVSLNQDGIFSSVLGELMDATYQCRLHIPSHRLLQQKRLVLHYSSGCGGPICSHFIDYRFVYTLNTKTLYSWLTIPKTLKLNAKTGGFAPPEPSPLNCLWLAISNWTSKIIDGSQVDKSIVDELKTSQCTTSTYSAMFIVAGLGTCVHDSRVVANSSLYAKLSDPSGKTCLLNGVHVYICLALSPGHTSLWSHCLVPCEHVQISFEEMADSFKEAVMFVVDRMWLAIPLQSDYQQQWENSFILVVSPLLLLMTEQVAILIINM